MTEKLKSLLHEQADHASFAMPDIDALTRDGARRVRRQRGGVLAAVAGIAVIAVGLPLALQSGGDDRARDDSDPVAGGVITEAQAFPRGPLVWAEGSTIHYGDDTLDVGRPVQAFVQTAAGFLVASDGDVLAADGGEVTQVGQVDADDLRLVGDEDGSLAGWVQDDSSDATFAVHDLALDVTTVEPAGEPVEGFEGTLAAPYFYAIEDGTAYWRTDEGTFQVGLDTNTGGVSSQSLFPVDGEDIGVADVENGTFAFMDDDMITIGATPDTAVAPSAPVSRFGVLSPDATYYAPDAEQLVVLDVTTGEDVGPTLDDYGFSAAYAWLDDDTVAVLAQTEDLAPFSLLTCSVSGGTCTETVEDTGELGDFQLPTGVAISD